MCAIKTSRSRTAPSFQPTPTSNGFEAFDDEDTPVDVINQLGTWAHNVKVGKVPQKQGKQVKVIRTPEDLNRFRKANPGVAELPIERKKSSKVC